MASATKNVAPEIEPAFVYDIFSINGTLGCVSDYVETGFFRQLKWPVVSVNPPSGQVSYQWQLSVNGGRSWGNIAGASASSLNTATLSLPSYGLNGIVPVLTVKSSYSYDVPAVRCRISVNGVITYSAIRPLVLSEWLKADNNKFVYDWSGWDADPMWEGCTTKGGAFNYGVWDGPSYVLYGSAFKLPDRRLSNPNFDPNRFYPFKTYGDKIVSIWEYSKNNGLTWATIPDNPPPGQLPYYFNDSTVGGDTPETRQEQTYSLAPSDAGIMFRARIGPQIIPGDKLVAYSLPIRVDYVVVGNDLPVLQDRVASNGSATFSLTIPPHPSGVPLTGSWGKSTNGGVTWTGVTGGTRELVGSATVLTLPLTGLTSAQDQTLYRCSVSAFGYSQYVQQRDGQQGSFGTTNSAILTV